MALSQAYSLHAIPFTCMEEKQFSIQDSLHFSLDIMERWWDHGPTQHQCFLEHQVCLFFCYRSTSFSNNPLSYLSLNKYLFQASPVLFSDIQIIVYWCQIHMHTSGLHLSKTHKSTPTIPTAHSFSSKCSSTAPSPAKYSYLPVHVSIST